MRYLVYFSRNQTLLPERYVILVLNLKMAVCWDTAPCSLIEIDQRFRGAYCLHHQGDE
jgi:hypothetical protein